LNIKSPQIPKIIYDTREKRPFKFSYFKIKKKRLITGDYTFAGWEKVIAIERKGCIKELFSNLSSRDRVRFKKNLLKLSKYPVRCIIVEDIKLQIKQKEQELEKWKNQLDKLYQDKAQTTINQENHIGDRDVLASKIKRLDGEVTAAKKRIEYLPYEINELKIKLQEAEKRETEIAKILPKQQQLVDDIIQMSKTLVDQLRVASDTNSKLKLLYQRYHNYQKETGKKLMPNSGVCSPSSSWLKCVFGILSQEVDGKRPHRTLGMGANMPL